MNRKGEGALQDNLRYLLALAIFIAMIFFYLWSKSNDAFLWEDFYAKEISRIISSGHAGDSYILDVHKGTSIALSNGVDIREASTMFIFDVQTKEVCAILSKGNGKCYPYLSDLVVSDVKIELGEPTNFLSFTLNKGEKDG